MFVEKCFFYFKKVTFFCEKYPFVWEKKASYGRNFRVLFYAEKCPFLKLKSALFSEKCPSFLLLFSSPPFSFFFLRGQTRGSDIFPIELCCIGHLSNGAWLYRTFLRQFLWCIGHFVRTNFKRSDILVFVSDNVRGLCI